MHKIPVYQPRLSPAVKKYVNECIDSSWISSKGKFISLFETAFADFIGSKYATTVCNGTAALHLALLALGVKPGDEVIVPTLTYVASANAITYVGATPVFVDSLPDSWQMDPRDVARKITSRTKAILAVHLYGHPCDLDSILSLCRKHQLFLIEDCAEAFGSKYKGKHVGVLGHIGTFSFFGNKTITTGEGGMAVSQDPDLHQKLGRYKAQGVFPDRVYWHDLIGYNYRMTNLCAAIGLAQLEECALGLSEKGKIAALYEQKLKGLPLRFHSSIGDVIHSYWMCSILVDPPSERDRLRDFLASRGIETRPFFYPVHHLPMYTNQEKHPVAEDLSYRGINLPSYPDLSEEDLDYICFAIHDFFLCERPSTYLDAEATAAVLQMST